MVTPDMNPWVPLTLAAWKAGRPARTLRTWARRLQIASACDPRTREVLVDIFEIMARTEQSEYRAPRRGVKAA